MPLSATYTLPPNSVCAWEVWRILAASIPEPSLVPTRPWPGLYGLLMLAATWVLLYFSSIPLGTTILDNWGCLLVDCCVLLQIFAFCFCFSLKCLLCSCVDSVSPFLVWCVGQLYLLWMAKLVMSNEWFFSLLKTLQFSNFQICIAWYWNGMRAKIILPPGYLRVVYFESPIFLTQFYRTISQ